mmetsp:Transcript_49434/g.92495  ORF Transcript_49434/g.92495 Transcript_49434/m.92495 type:complete len:83 (+) Transcript_49434:307-555(+)
MLDCSLHCLDIAIRILRTGSVDLPRQKATSDLEDDGGQREEAAAAEAGLPLYHRPEAQIATEFHQAQAIKDAVDTSKHCERQ